MDQFETYILLFAIIVAVGVTFNKSPVPTALLLVVTGMLLSLIPNFPRIDLNPHLVLNIFLPLLIYQISIYSSWRDVKHNLRPVILLSVGHVLFITILVAIVIRFLNPLISWPMALLIGSVLSPPDDVAIVAIGEKIRLPQRIITILKAEGMFNDATALILFRFSLIAIITHEFSAIEGISNFFMVIIGETLYGLFLGYVVGNIRLKIEAPILQMMSSILTPFLAYTPAVHLGGCGVLATAITGMILEQRYSDRLKPEYRLFSKSVWSTIAFALESILFLLVGLEMRFILERISLIPTAKLWLLSSIIILTVILGRFFWVYPMAYIPRFLFPSIRKNDPVSWQNVFVISWAGMRGGISLAAALAVPALPALSDGIKPADLIVFLVFSVIIATLILQGLALPWVLEILGVQHSGQREDYLEHLSELSARLSIAKAVLRWLLEYKKQVKDDPKLCEDINFRIQEYRTLKSQLKERIADHGKVTHDESSELKQVVFLSSQLVEIERQALLRLWRKEKISYTVKTKLLQQLDYRSRHLLE